MAPDGLGLRVEDREENPASQCVHPRLRAAANRLAYRFFPELAALALKTRAARPRFSRIPEIFSRGLRQLSPTLNESLLDLYGRSEQVLANRFTFFNLSEEFGPEIDWEGHASTGWRAELHAFDYAFELALTYRISREERYSRHLRYLLAEWIAANPPGQGSGWMRQTLARRVRNWILAADLARDDWEQDPDFLHLVTESLAIQCVYLVQQIESHGSGTRALECARALQLAGKFFDGAEAAEFAGRSMTILQRELATHLAPGPNQSPAPPSSLLRLAVTVMALLLLAPGGGEKFRQWLKPQLLKCLQLLEETLLPDGTQPLFGSPAGPAPETLGDLFALGAVIFQNPRWKCLAGEFGILPYMYLGEEGKTCFERLPNSGWQSSRITTLNSLARLVGDEGTVGLINILPTTKPGEYRDYLSYELFMAGQRVIVDSGAFTPEGETWDPYFKSPRAHNVLLVDDQAPRLLSSNGCAFPPQDPESASSPSRLCLANSGFRFLGLDHTRVLGWLDGRCWAVLDRLEGTGLHRCEIPIHFYPTFAAEAANGRVVVRSRSFAFTIIPLGSSSAVTISKGDHPAFPGWYSPDIGIKYAASVLTLGWARVQPPWLGGYLLVPGTEVDFCDGEINPAEGLVSFQLFGKTYRLVAR